MAKYYIGCSGYYYPEWKGAFYPQELKSKDWLRYYTEHFDTLEINSTFYRFPKPGAFKTWFKDTPDHFKFAVKAPRIFTHYRKFIGTDDLLFDFYSIAAEELQEKLGCILFQFPANFHYSADKLERITASLDPAFKNALEFRHISWWDGQVFDTLKRHNITFCSISLPTLPDDLIVTADMAYYRYHGRPELYKSEYQPAELEHVATQLKGSSANEIYVYFNNTMNVAAIANAKLKKDLCR